MSSAHQSVTNLTALSGSLNYEKYKREFGSENVNEEQVNKNVSVVFGITTPPFPSFFFLLMCFSAKTLNGNQATEAEGQTVEVQQPDSELLLLQQDVPSCNLGEEVRSSANSLSS